MHALMEQGEGEQLADGVHGAFFSKLERLRQLLVQASGKLFLDACLLLLQLSSQRRERRNVAFPVGRLGPWRKEGRVGGRQVRTAWAVHKEVLRDQDVPHIPANVVVKAVRDDVCRFFGSAV